MTLTVAIVAAGNMGAGMGQRLTENKVAVLTSLAGRSDASVRRAQAAGMTAADDAQLAEADIFLSILPPGEAQALARRMAPALSAAARKPVYVDCNAVSPGTMQETADIVAASGAPFVAGGIIGPPPKPGANNTVLYVSGPSAPQVARLNDHGLIVTVLDGPLTAAPALKMSYAGITKGFTALGAAMLLAAARGGAADALKAELQRSRPDLLKYLSGNIPAMYSKAYRWVAEMDEIAAFIGGDKPEHAMQEAAARFYERIAADFDDDKHEIGTLDKFLGQ